MGSTWEHAKLDILKFIEIRITLLPERPKGAKDEVKRPEGPPARSRGPEGP